MLHRLILFIGIALITFSCGKDNNEECSGICTEEFRSINVEITEGEENPIILDSISVTDITNNRELDLNSENEFNEGFYTIFSDNFVSEYKKEEISLRFQGFQNEELIVEESYKVGADCCHVYHISGPLKIVVE